MVLLDPPAPAALVELGRALATLSFCSAAARRRIAVLGPPGGVGEVVLPDAEPAGALDGEEARGADCPLLVRPRRGGLQSFMLWWLGRGCWGNDCFQETYHYESLNEG